MLLKPFVATLCSLTLGASESRAEIKVVATTPEYGALAQAVGGSRVTVTSLAKPTEDPHYVDARPSHVVTLNKADVLVESGADLEIGWLPPLVDGARNRNILPGGPGYVRAAEGVSLLDVPAVLDRSQGDLHAAGNPHFMMDPQNALPVARHLTDVFCRVDAAGAEAYRQNLAAFEQKLQQKMDAWRAKLAPFRGTPIVTYHNTWRYFANRFGLVTDLFLEPKPGIPPSPPHLAQVIETMKAKGIKVILVEPFQSRKTAEAVAAHTGAQVVEVAQFPGGLPGTDDYFSLMDTVVDAVATALAGHRA